MSGIHDTVKGNPPVTWLDVYNVGDEIRECPCGSSSDVGTFQYATVAAGLRISGHRCVSPELDILRGWLGSSR